MTEKLYSVAETMKLTGHSRSVIDLVVRNEKICLVNGKVKESDIERMVQEKESYISLMEYAVSRSTERFNGRIVRYRVNLRETLIKHGFFGLHTLEPDTILTGTERDMLYFLREDIPVLDQNLSNYFVLFEMPEREKVNVLLKTALGHKHTKEYILKFIQTEMFEKEIKPSFMEFVKRVLSLPDVDVLMDEDIRKELESVEITETKTYMVRWLNFVRRRRNVMYGEIRMKQKESVSVPAYSMDTYFALARCFFNAEYIHEHNMIEKALDNHKYAEMWLYLTLFYACGWRAGDVCNGWRYLRLKDHPEGCFGLDPGTLYEDILYDRIQDETYENVCKYAIGSIEVSGELASKTSDIGTHPLLAVVTPELHAFYGLLTLISESHMIRSGKGYMTDKRIPEYQNKRNLKQFFGSDIEQILHGENIQSRRLNKDYLQAVESEGRKEGYGGILTSALASYARNHVNTDTIKVYLKDHTLTGETADVVLFFLAERGVFGFELYQTLITAFPDVMNRLSIKEQNRIIEQMKVTPLLLEQRHSGLLASETVKESFMNGDETMALEMLRNMYEISQMKGKGKDTGIYCLKRAAGKACIYPEWNSCIANACPYLVFSRYGFMPLLKVLKEYQEKADNGNIKARSVLKEVLIPRYQKIINRIIKEFNLDQEERIGLKQLMTEVLHG
ncbi:MAG: hypothetical protein IJO13_05745 [Lachnospiraceae bacterium]|nr:hypothetical protein [Lachnospiraceae bacterium]